MRAWTRSTITALLFGVLLAALSNVPPVRHIASELAAPMPAVFHRAVVVVGGFTLLALAFLASASLLFPQAPASRGGAPSRSVLAGPGACLVAVLAVLGLGFAFPAARAALWRRAFRSSAAPPLVVRTLCDGDAAKGMVLVPALHPVDLQELPAASEVVEVNRAALERGERSLIDAGVFRRDRPVWSPPDDSGGPCRPAVELRRGRLRYAVSRQRYGEDRAFDALIAALEKALPPAAPPDPENR